MAEQHLTKSELAIMEVMWEQEEALTASEIIKASGDKEWKNSSIHLMVNALLEKGFLEVAGFYLCIPDCIRNKHNDRCTFGILSF